MSVFKTESDACVGVFGVGGPGSAQMLWDRNIDSGFRDTSIHTPSSWINSQRVFFVLITDLSSQCGHKDSVALTDFFSGVWLFALAFLCKS